MALAESFDNRVRALRQARGWTQQQLAHAARLSRTGVCAIEAQRLVPSVAAALALAQALECSVEDLFGAQPRSPEQSLEFAWLPQSFPCRFWVAEIAGRSWLFPVEGSPRNGLLHDGVARHARDFPASRALAARTLVVATCDPAAGFLADMYERRSQQRLLVFTRTSREAIALVAQGLAHVAGVHFAAASDSGGNHAELVQRASGSDLTLLHVAKWEEGLALRPASHLRTASGAARAKLRWIGRVPGAAARRFQDELLGPRRNPRHVAHDHRGVAEAIRSHWADVGVCLRLVSEEAGLRFLSMGQEQYDLCFPDALAGDPRIVHLIESIRSLEYRQLLDDLPGYGPQRALGEIEHVGP